MSSALQPVAGVLQSAGVEENLQGSGQHQPTALPETYHLGLIGSWDWMIMRLFGEVGMGSCLLLLNLPCSKFYSRDALQVKCR